MNNYTILIAEDQEFNLHVVIGYLQQGNDNYKVLTAENGQEACEIAKAQLPDLVIMDWEMPIMTGIDAVKELKSYPSTTDIPIIMATANTSSEKLKVALDAGAVDYIRKPIDKVELVARVHSTLKLSDSYKKIKNQKSLIEKSQRQITDSINYASRIQEAFLPPQKKIQAAFPDSFIFFRPRNVVSGDFYWFADLRNNENPLPKIIIAAVDCTGHGVPGALMSMLGNSFLNQIILHHQIIQPDQILNALDKQIKTTLNQDETDNEDGMDIAICVIDVDKNELEFAGAENPMVYIANSKAHIVKGDPQSIAGWSIKEKKPFTKYSISFDKPVTIYLFSDGYQDQFGGKSSRKFLRSRLIKLFEEIHHLPMQKQKKVIEQKFEKWKENHRQVDDVLIIGFKCNTLSK